MVLTRRYNLSSSTFLTLGIAVSNKLESAIQVVLSNKNDIALELSREALTSLYSAENKQHIKSFLEQKDIRAVPIQLDADFELHFIKMYNLFGLSIRNKEKIQISFLETSAERLGNLKPLIDCYIQKLEKQLDKVREQTTKVKLIFENYYYTSIYDNKIIKKILKYGDYDSFNIIELELIGLCSKTFLSAIELQKRNEVVEVEN